MNTLAIILIILAVFEIVVGPFVIGKERDPMKPLSYLITSGIWACVILLAGHTLGWWLQ